MQRRCGILKTLSVFLTIFVVSTLYNVRRINFTRFSEDDAKTIQGVNQSLEYIGDNPEVTTQWIDIEQSQTTIGAVPTSGSQRPLNVLFMIADDMRPQLGCYINEDAVPSTRHINMITPNLDKLASRSLVLSRFYTQYSLCGPSRVSIMTGRRPDMTKVYNNNDYWRESTGNFTTIPQYFKQNGYFTYSTGKIFHQGPASNNQDPISWSDKSYFPPYVDEIFYPLSGEKSADQSCAGMEAVNNAMCMGSSEEKAGYKSVSDEERKKVTLIDDLTFDKFKAKLQHIAPGGRTGQQPFFLAFGFSRPHLNLICPQKFMDMYEIERDRQYLEELEWQTPRLKKGCQVANSTLGADGRMHVTNQGLRHIRHAYAACISHVDDLVGDIIEQLHKHDLSNNTIIVFTADHGYHLGENGFFGKGTNHETATRVPFILHVPGQTGHGIVSRMPSEGVDMFQTLTRAANLTPVPNCGDSTDDPSSELCTQGKNLLELIKDPDLQLTEGALSQIQVGPGRTKYSLRSRRFRLTMVAEKDQDGVSLKKQHRRGDPELYDLESDPYERINQYDNPVYSSFAKDMTKKLTSKLSTFQKMAPK